ncbi:type II toxin-antitoxin system RelE/ParE family toxin [Agrobacterium vitis]|uniref:type II toxin-antitoxin system RelE/ParE family toxin n=1 Tax=Agrobacterium vitis TaxID=373 RepID=UPI0012E8328D|nr:hypothetical protein [Agrobacterium vitis]
MELNAGHMNRLSAISTYSSTSLRRSRRSPMPVSPNVGEDVSWIRKDYRRRRVGVHLVFYRKLDLAIIEIIRVLHEHMDVERQLDYSAVRHIWRTKVRCSALYLLHNFLFKPIPV